MRVPIVIALCCGAALVACSSSSSKSDGAAASGADVAVVSTTATSGARLRTKVITGGGARQVLGFFDKLRNEDCDFERTSDGKLRCLPQSLNVGVGGAFADPACKVPIAYLPTCAPATVKYVTTFGSDGCRGSVASVRPLKAAVKTIYLPNGAGGCAAQPAPTSNVTAFETGDELPLAQFVGADETSVKNGDLTERIAAAEDGSRLHLGFHHDASGADCTFEVMADGVTRCVPNAISGQVFYSDETCSTPAFTYSTGNVGNCSTNGPDLLRESAPGSNCNAVRGIYHVAAALGLEPDDRTFYIATGSSTGSTCISTTGSRGLSSRYTLENVTGGLPTVDRIGKGAGRLVPALVGVGGIDALVQGFHDFDRNVDCTFVKASDGKIRCMPAGPNGVAFYVDAQCKSPGRVAVFNGPLSCAQAASPYTRVSTAPPANPNNPQCNVALGVADAAPVKVFNVTGTAHNVTGASIDNGPGRCAQVAGVNGAFDATEVDPAGFVEGTIVVE